MTSYEYYYGLLAENERDFFRYMPTINDLVRFAGEHFSADLALDGAAGPMSYKKLIDDLAGLRGFLREQGVQKGALPGVWRSDNRDRDTVSDSVAIPER